MKKIIILWEGVASTIVNYSSLFCNRLTFKVQDTGKKLVFKLIFHFRCFLKEFCRTTHLVITISYSNCNRKSFLNAHYIGYFYISILIFLTFEREWKALKIIGEWNIYSEQKDGESFVSTIVTKGPQYSEILRAAFYLEANWH